MEIKDWRSAVAKLKRRVLQLEARIAAQISHTALSDIGTNTHAQIDTHIAGTGTAVHGDSYVLNTGDIMTGNLTFTKDIPQVLLRSPSSTNQYYIGANISDSVDGGIHIGEGTGVGQTLRMAIAGNGDVSIDTDTFYASAANNRVGINTTSPAVSLDVNGGLAFRVGTMSLSNGENNNVAVGDRTFFNITNPTAAFSISGLAAGSDGQFIVLGNFTGQNMTIEHQDVSSTDVNRIITTTAADMTTTGNGVVMLVYSTGVSRWILINMEV